MTYEDVKRIRANPTIEDVDNKELHKLINEAIEKQIPKTISFVPACSRCNYPMDALIRNVLNYCPNCGQKIDWEMIKYENY